MNGYAHVIAVFLSSAYLASLMASDPPVLVQVYPNPSQSVYEDPVDLLGKHLFVLRVDVTEGQRGAY